MTSQILIENSSPIVPVIGSHLFLHLSDIHFHKATSNKPFDLDEDLRRKLASDANDFTSKHERVTAILVTGDIAFSADQAEYDIAAKWLDSLATTVRCQPKIILTTPGNHDIDRRILDKDRTLRGYQRELRNSSPDDIDDILTALLLDETARVKLFEPLKSYNHFAANFGCDINHDRPCWERSFDLNENIKLRFRGLNSVLACNKDDDTEPRRLNVGLHQVQVDDTDRRIIHVTLCHHPPDWLIDYDNVHTYLSDRVALQLFGHKHFQKVDTTNGRIRVTAGAVHPSRRERNWVPRYNFIQIWLTRIDDVYDVNFRIYPRIWKQTKFGPDYGDDGKEYAKHTIRIGRLSHTQSAAQTIKSPSGDSEVPVVPIDVDVELALEESINIISDEVKTMGNTSNYAPVLVRRFLNLGVYDRKLIAEQLDLIDSEERKLPDQELLTLVITRARDKHLLGQLWERVEATHNDGLYDINPFTGK
ncbi:MAG: metallophosphoesterase [Acidobacteriota bacterium]|nr:metallophosphoesterase [Acidobacteriota bacterium]